MTLICLVLSFFFFFNDTATTEIYTLSLHDALPISDVISYRVYRAAARGALEKVDERPAGERSFVDKAARRPLVDLFERDRKSTRLNSSHSQISYAVFFLEKKKKNQIHTRSPYV